MNPPKISIVIPSFNKAKYINKTLSSIFNQTYKNFEVIIQDGGSTDGTLEIIKCYIKTHPKQIIFTSKKDNGQLDAINKGLNKCTGNIVTFINADDYYEKTALEAVASYAIENPSSLWFAGSAMIVDGKNTEIAKGVTWYKNKLLFLNKYFFLLTTNYLMQPSVFITKKAFDSFGPFKGTKDFVMEYELWLKIGKHAMPVIINKNLSYFRIESTTKTKTMFEELLKEDEKIVRNYSNNIIILLIHYLNNLGRRIIGRWV